MPDVIQLLRAARRGAVLVAAEMWRRAVIEGTASEDDAMEADARLAKVETELRNAEAEQQAEETARRREQETARDVIVMELRKGPQPDEASLAESTHLPLLHVRRALRTLMSRRIVVRASGSGAYQLA